MRGDTPSDARYPCTACADACVLPGPHSAVLRKGWLVVDSVRNWCLAGQVRWVCSFRLCPAFSLSRLASFLPISSSCVRVELWLFYFSLPGRCKVAVCLVGLVSGWFDSCTTVFCGRYASCQHVRFVAAWTCVILSFSARSACGAHMLSRGCLAGQLRWVCSFCPCPTIS